MSQTDFASRIRTLPSTVSKWEAGKNRPTPDAFTRIARIAEGTDKAFFLDQAGVSANYFDRKGSTDWKEDKATDAELLAEILDAVNKAANRQGVCLALRKYACIAAQVYDSWRQEGPRDSSLPDRMVSCVCAPSNRKVHIAPA